jgi:hypothetical protein
MNLRLAIAAALAGSAIGAAVVLANDRPAPKVAAVGPAKTAPGDQRPPVHARDITIEARARDPGGGPPWAVRRFTAPAAECVELGRIVNSAFGWIDGYGTFHPARAGRHATPDLCLPAESIRRIGAQPIATTTVTYPRDRSPRPSRGIVWGIAAPDIRAIRAEGSPELDVTKRGAFLGVGEQPAQLSGTGEMVRRDGSIRRYDRGPEYPKTVIAPKAGTTRVALEAPDPAGGLPWAILVADGPHGELCRSQPGRLLRNRLGVIERPLDTFEPAFGELFCRHVPRPPTPAFPLRLTAGNWSQGFGDDSRGRVERRVLQGRTTIGGEADPSVVSVTLRTPRDVRTLVPSRPDHMILAVYEGAFPAGNVTATAHLNDGRDVTRSVYVG